METTLKRENAYFTSEAEFVTFLNNFKPLNVGKAAIMAGHFMLTCDPESKTFVPMIWQDSDNVPVRDQSKTYAGDFPVDSFTFGLQLLGHWKSVGIDIGIVLLINDHQFLSVCLPQEDIEIVISSASELRKAFYRESGDLPNSYKAVLEQFDLKAKDVLFRNDKAGRTPQDTLPKHSIYFSEKTLRNRFDQFRRKELLERTARNSFDVTEENQQVRFVTNDGRSFFLTEEGTCGCSGELVEFIFELSSAGVQDLVLFTPQDCGKPVVVGIEAALYLLKQKGISPMRITNIAGIESLHDHSVSEYPILIEANTFLLDSSPFDLTTSGA